MKKCTSSEVHFYLLFKFNYHYFRAVEQAERKPAVAYAAADYNSGIVQFFHACGIRRENTLIWHKHTIVGKRYAKLPTVGVTCQCQVYMVVAIGVYEFRSVA